MTSLDQFDQLRPKPRERDRTEREDRTERKDRTFNGMKLSLGRRHGGREEERAREIPASRARLLSLCLGTGNVSRPS